MPGPADELPDLCGLTVLIAESNPLIALDLVETIRAWGGEPLLYSELTPAEQAAAPDRVCAALIDMTQNHQQQTRLIGDLHGRGVPIVLTTAWQLDIIGDQFPEMAIFEKPVNYTSLASWFADLGRLELSPQCRCNG